MKKILIQLLLLLSGVSSSNAYYQAEQGRWLNRDPIEERGGVNVYSMAVNDPVDYFDYLGLSDDGEWGFTSYLLYIMNKSPDSAPDLDWTRDTLAKGCIGVTCVNVGEQVDPIGTDTCFKKIDLAETKKNTFEKNGCCDSTHVYSVHLWNDIGQDGKNPDVSENEDGSVSLRNWNYLGRPQSDGNFGVGFDFGYYNSDGSIHHADRYHNPENWNGTGMPRRNDRKIHYMTVMEKTLSEWQSEIEGEDRAFNKEVWCVHCEK